MAKNKTDFTEESVIDFVESVEQAQKKSDSYQLIKLMSKISGEPAKMFGPSIIGFGEYHYKYKSGHEGKAPLIGFSPRKTAISLYVFTGLEEHKHLLEDLGKYTIGKACIYIKKLSDINEQILICLMQTTIQYLETKYNRT